MAKKSEAPGVFEKIAEKLFGKKERDKKAGSPKPAASTKATDRDKGKKKSVVKKKKAAKKK